MGPTATATCLLTTLSTDMEPRREPLRTLAWLRVMPTSGAALRLQPPLHRPRPLLRYPLIPRLTTMTFGAMPVIMAKLPLVHFMERGHHQKDRYLQREHLLQQILPLPLPLPLRLRLLRSRLLRLWTQLLPQLLLRMQHLQRRPMQPTRTAARPLIMMPRLARKPLLLPMQAALQQLRMGMELALILR